MTDKETMPELLPCPFCGGNGVLESYKIYLGHGDYKEELSVHCEKCRCNFRDSWEDLDQAIKAWNTRNDTAISKKALIELLEGRRINSLDPVVCFPESYGYALGHNALIDELIKKIE